MNEELQAYQEQIRKEYEGKAFTRPSINLIVTYVVRMMKRAVIITADGREYDIQWNPMYTEPEIIEPGTIRTNIRGIVDVVEWLRNVPEGATFQVKEPIKGMDHNR